MAIYSNLSKLGRVKLPSGSEYALIDVDGRAIIAPNFSGEASYDEGDHVIYQDNLYRFNTNHAAGAWNATQVALVTVDAEIKRLEGLISGGIHYRGKTSTALHEGAATNPITINGASYTAEAGDMVIMDLEAVKVNYAVNTAYAVNTYIKDGGIYYIVIDAISASENTSINAIRGKLNVIPSDPEFLFDGAVWNVLGSISDGLGDLAFKDSASGTYVKPTGSGTVTVSTVGSNNGKLVTTQITGTNGTVNATYVTGGTEKDIAKVGAAVRYGTANVGTAVVAGQADVGTAVRYGTANVDTEIEVGTSLTGTTSFNTDAIKSAALTGTKTFNTDAIKSATATGTDGTTAAKAAVLTSVDGDCLVFTAAGTTTIGVSTSPASTGTVGIETSPATKASVGLGKTGITPAIAAPNTQTLTPAVAASRTITPAVAAPNDQTLTPAASNGTLTGSYNLSQQTPAKVASAATTVATGGIAANASGDTVVTQVNVGSTTATVSVGTTTDTVVVD